MQRIIIKFDENYKIIFKLKKNNIFIKLDQTGKKSPVELKDIYIKDLNEFINHKDKYFIKDPSYWQICNNMMSGKEVSGPYYSPFNKNDFKVKR